MCLKKVPRNRVTKDRGGGGTLGGGDSMKDEKVSLVDGVFKVALGALGLLEALEMEAIVDAMVVYGG
ncbi:hypothetical protein Tco_1199732 [Tanacetum coccineum]